LKIWSKIKLGIIPIVLLGVPVFIFYELLLMISAIRFRVFGNPFLDVPLSVAIVLGIAFVFGHILEWPRVKDWIRKYYIKIPFLGRILLVLAIPKHELEIIEVKTTPGPTHEEGCWEYAVITKDWEENGMRWYRAHTIGIGGKLFSRISESNVRHLSPREKKAVWLTVLSFGFLE
jgi:hypothetical protein